jgi:HK97 family phage portal protein
MVAMAATFRSGPVGAIARVVSQASRNLKSLTMRWPGHAASLRLLPRTMFNYRSSVGDGTGSSVVIACIAFVMRTFPEAEVRLRRRESDGTMTPDYEHPMLALIDDPNPYYDGLLLFQATVADLDISGNAYWLKERSGAGRPVRLWYVPSTMIAPKFPADGSEFISSYAYRPDGSKPPIEVDPADVVHFRFGLDPANVRLGRAPLASVLREIFTDDEAANFTASLLRNLGVPGVVISPGPDVEIDPESGETIKQTFRDAFGGDRRGDVMVLTAQATAQVLSFSPLQMDLKALRRIPEERTSAVLGIPAIVAGLGAGLDRSTFANYREAREAAYESNIIPKQWLIAGALRRQLLPDFGDTAGLVLDFDNSNVRVLQEDLNGVEARFRGGLLAGAMMVSEYRSAIGLPTTPEHDLYLRPINLLEVPSGGEGRTEPPGELPKFGRVEPAPPRLDLGWREVPRPALPAPTRKAQPSAASQARFVQRLGREAQVYERRFAADLARAFDRLGRAVAARLASLAKSAEGGGYKVDVPDTPAELPPDWPAILGDILAGAGSLAPLLPADLLHQLLAAEYQANYAQIGDATFAAVSDQLGTVIGFNLDDPYAIALLDAGGTNAGLVDIDQQTRDAIFQALIDGREAGEGIPQLIDRIQGYVEGAHMYPGIAEEQGADAAAMYRAQVIARTETRVAQNLSSLLAYQKSELVAGVLVFDGDGCGWRSHTDPDLADGSRRTLDEAYAQPLAHPQCVRAFAPLLHGD